MFFKPDLADAQQPFQDVIKYRKRRNLINIYTTFWTWIIQSVLNGLTVFFLLFIFGRMKFHQHLFAILNVGVNFAFLPSVFVIMDDDRFRSALGQRKFFEALKVFCNFPVQL